MDFVQSFQKRLFFLAAIVLSCVWYLDDGVLEGKSLVPNRASEGSYFPRGGVLRQPIQIDNIHNYLLGRFRIAPQPLLARASQNNG
jgi:hypothetical protein